MIVPPSSEFDERPQALGTGEDLLSATLKSAPSLALDIHSGGYEIAEALASARNALFESFRFHGVDERLAIRWTVAVTADIRRQLAKLGPGRHSAAEPAAMTASPPITMVPKAADL
jgi:hypothetical protein